MVSLPLPSSSLLSTYVIPRWQIIKPEMKVGRHYRSYREILRTTLCQSTSQFRWQGQLPWKTYSPSGLMHKDTSHMLMISDLPALPSSLLNFRLPFSTASGTFPPKSCGASKAQSPPSLIVSPSVLDTCCHPATQARNFTVYPGPSLSLNPPPSANYQALLAC